MLLCLGCHARGGGSLEEHPRWLDNQGGGRPTPYDRWATPSYMWDLSSPFVGMCLVLVEVVGRPTNCSPMTSGPHLLGGDSVTSLHTRLTIVCTSIDVSVLANQDHLFQVASGSFAHHDDVFGLSNGILGGGGLTNMSSWAPSLVFYPFYSYVGSLVSLEGGE
jgi:hypothetical protein